MIDPDDLREQRQELRQAVRLPRQDANTGTGTGAEPQAARDRRVLALLRGDRRPVVEVAKLLGMTTNEALAAAERAVADAQAVLS